MKRPPSHSVLAVFIVALWVIVAGAVWAAWPPETPAPPPAQTLPAPLPPNVGIDGEGIAPGVAPSEAQPDGLPKDPEQLPPDVQAQPDAGSPAIVVPQGEGTGGEVYVRSPAWAGAQRLAAGYRYSSGSLHAAWDVGVDVGTKVFATKDGLIVGRNDGVRNHPSGSQYAVSGSPSNWVLLCSTVNGRPAVQYFQHLSPGLKVKRGQVAKRGQWIARSGNTGNSTGPHLHISASYSPWGCKAITASRAEFLRYDYLRTESRRLFAPSRFWAVPAKPAAKPVVDTSAVAAACKRNGKAANVHVVRGALKLNTNTDGCGPLMRKTYAKYQRALGYRGRAADGIPGYSSLARLGRAKGFVVVR